ncbi:class II aldolase/adducin family protein [Micromonospora sp. NPDC005087]|uniref:class II aldolase/adducin family protein n=1 Tax=Micromonospora sp. NPDC005087 TaxID=3364225 RepID=UPI0036BF415D
MLAHGAADVPPVSAQVADLVAANQILVAQGVLDAFGHVSVRSDRDPERFLLARNLAPSLVRESDVLEFDLDGETSDSRPVYLERFIHGEIYRARPDVTAVIHSHSPAVVAFSISDQPLQAVMHMAGFLAAPTPVFEIRDVVGSASDLLIRDSGLGRALARSLGDAPVALMRGHGSVTVAGSLKDAVFRAVYTEANAEVQANALRLGACTYLTEEEGAAAAATIASQVDRAWGIWLTKARASLGNQDTGHHDTTRVTSISPANDIPE